MTPERWHQVNKLFTAVVELEPPRRAAFLDQSCADDQMLRSEVESLLASDERGWNVIEKPALELAAPLLAHEQQQLTPGQTFTHYEIVSLIGKGGMGEVYLAADKLLNRKIALKLLPADYTRDRERLRRFQQEAQAASALNHPNILTIHEIGQAEDQRFIATEFVDGETLRQRLKRAPLNLSDTLEISIQIASALSAAHQAGIVHRDIKPENIMLRRDGYVKVLDFGLAKLAEQSTAPQTEVYATRDADDVNLSSGLLMGTLKYMSPEQARGEQVDARSDIFSFGVVLYEMIAGHVPFEGNTRPDLISAILKREAPPLPNTPQELRNITMKALAKNREKRYHTVAELLIDLKRLKEERAITRMSTPTVHKIDGLAQVTSAAAVIPTASATEHFVGGIRPHFQKLAFGLVAIIVLTAAAAIYFRSSRKEEAINSVAILPFVNATSDPNVEYLSDGIADQLTNTLSRLPGVTVISSNAMSRYRVRDPGAASPDPQAVGRELKVGAVVVGKMTQTGESIHLDVELVDVRTDRHLWGEEYHGKLADILRIQEDIAKSISASLKLRLTEQQQNLLAMRYTESPEAYQAYLKGRYFWNKRTDEGVMKAAEYFQQAIDLDPHCSRAYVGLADCYLFGQPPLPPKTLASMAKSMAGKALEIDDTIGEAYATLGLIAENFDWDWAQAEREYKRALELNPNYATAHQWYGEYLGLTGRFDEALQEMKLASELDPLSLIIMKDTGEIYYFARQYDVAIEYFRKALEMDPNFFIARVNLGLAYSQKGEFSAAIAEFEKARQLQDSTDILSELGYVYAISGRRRDAEKKLSELSVISKQRYTSAGHFARIYAGLGEKDKALEWLEKEYQEGGLLTGLKVDPHLDNLRADPRFADLMKRVGLAH